MKPKVISLKFVSASNATVDYLMVETDDEVFAKQLTYKWGEQKLGKPFISVEIHQGTLDAPDYDSETFDGVRVWALPF